MMLNSFSQHQHQMTQEGICKALRLSPKTNAAVSPQLYVPFGCKDTMKSFLAKIYVYKNNFSRYPPPRFCQVNLSNRTIKKLLSPKEGRPYFAPQEKRKSRRKTFYLQMLMKELNTALTRARTRALQEFCTFCCHKCHTKHLFILIINQLNQNIRLF